MTRGNHARSLFKCSRSNVSLYRVLRAYTPWTDAANLADHPQDAIRVQTHEHAVAIDKGDAEPARSLHDRDILRHDWPGTTVPANPARGPGRR